MKYCAILNNTIKSWVLLGFNDVLKTYNECSNSNNTISMLPPTERLVAHYNVNVRISNWQVNVIMLQNIVIASRQQKISMF